VWFYQHADKSNTLTDVPESLPEPEEGWEIELVRSLRRLGRSYNTEKSYRSWCKRFVRFSRPEKPENLTMEHLTAFLDDLAVKQRVSQGTQRQALNALVFWFRKVRSMEIPEKLEFGKARIKKNLPVVLHKNEVKALLEKLPGTYKLMGQLQYGSGMRVSDLLRLRVKDIDYENGYILVRFGKGEKDRRVQLPEKVVESLKVHMAKLESLYHEDQAANLPGVYLPSSLERKYPKAGEKWIWQWVLLFCATLVDVSSQAPRYQADN
jgi:site-specific recombinase XerD